MRKGRSFMVTGSIYAETGSSGTQTGSHCAQTGSTCTQTRTSSAQTGSSHTFDVLSCGAVNFDLTVDSSGRRDALVGIKNRTFLIVEL